MTSSSSLPRALAAVAFAAFALSACALAGRASYGARTTGDEPHYLLTAISLAEDRDLDVSDEIAARRYEAFSEVGLNRQSRRLEDGRMVSPHDPLLPLLLAPGVALAGWTGAKLTLALMGAATAALALWVAVRRFGAPVGPAAVVVGLFAATPPLSVYATQVYPELPAALATLAAVAVATAKPSRRRTAGLALAISALPWLSVKYAPVAAAVAAVAAWKWWRRGERRDVVWLGGVLALSGVAFVAAHWAWYGGWTPYAVGDHFVTGELGVVGFDPNPAGRSTRLVGLLVDRAFGLAAWQPAWLLAVPAATALALRRRGASGRAFLLVPAAAGWLNATFVALTMHGWWCPGRQVVVIAPLLAIAVALWAGESRHRVAWTAALGAAGLVSWAYLVAEVLARRLTLVVDFYDTSNPLYRAWSTLLPDYRDPGASTWVLHALWIGAAALSVWWVARRPLRASASPGGSG
ncbi:MAG: hypothetical protein M3279_02975 [Actinomycetota bacterium]|nr:hypothetical protein [Actinomycetota bacterium]